MPGPTTQNDVLRAMSPAQKLQAAVRLYWSARSLKEAALRKQHPTWTDDQLRRAVNGAFLYARD